MDDKQTKIDIDLIAIAMTNITKAIECIEKVHSIELIRQMNSLDEVCTDLRFERKRLIHKLMGVGDEE